MELVELSPLRNLLVGSPAQTGLSVEQRKRLSIAVELISNPAIVLMDEPTSGNPLNKLSNASETRDSQLRAYIDLHLSFHTMDLRGALVWYGLLRSSSAENAL